MWFRSEEVARWLLSHGARIVLIVVAVFVVRRILHAVIHRMERLVEDEDKERLSEAEKRAQTLGRILRGASTVLLVLVSAMMVLRELGMDIGPLIAGAGVAGLAIGFGAQSLVKDVITGFFILLEDQIRVGDVIEAAGVSGLVESMNLRTTVLRDLQGRVHVIPNGEIKVVSNQTKGWSRAVVDVSVAYGEDLDEILRVIRALCDELADDPDVAPAILERPEVLGVDSLGDSGVAIRVTIKTRPLEQWRVAREFRRRVKNTFAARGIEIPYPHRTVHIANPPDAREPRRESAPRSGT